MHLPEITLAWKLIWQNLHLAKLHFPESLFARIYTCRNVHLAEIICGYLEGSTSDLFSRNYIFPRKLIFQKLHFLKNSFSRNYFTFEKLYYV